VGQTCQHVITVEDGVKDGGLGSAVLEYLSAHGMHPEVTRLGMPTTTFVEHGTVSQLQHMVVIDPEEIKSTIEKELRS
jgi:1-deoxy-D-xylulose-5-phosphate synthase